MIFFHVWSIQNHNSEMAASPATYKLPKGRDCLFFERRQLVISCRQRTKEKFSFSHRHLLFQLEISGSIPYVHSLYEGKMHRWLFLCILRLEAAILSGSPGFASPLNSEADIFFKQAEEFNKRKDLIKAATLSRPGPFHD